MTFQKTIIAFFLLAILGCGSADAKTTADYIAEIDTIKTYLDPMWDGTNHWYAEPDPTTGSPKPLAYINASMIKIVAILAGQGQASGTDIARIKALVEGPFTTTRYIGNSWYHVLNDTSSGYHQANHYICAEACYYAWKYRVELGLTSTAISALYDILTVDRTYDTYNYHTLSFSSSYGYALDALGRFGLMTLQYGYLAGNTGLASHIQNQIKYAADHFDASAPPSAWTSGFLFPDFGFLYYPGDNYESLTYGSMALGGMLALYPEFSSIEALTPTQIARIKAFERHILGQFQRNGLLNWQMERYSNSRIYSGQYWDWSLMALLGIARASELNQNSSDSQYARWMFDQAIDTFIRMDTWRTWGLTADAADNVPPRSQFPITDFYQTNGTVLGIVTNSKGNFAAKFAGLLALAVEWGIPALPSSPPPNLWRWSGYSKALTVSTPFYSAASLPNAGLAVPATSNYIYNQNWGLSQVINPDGVVLTSIGGYGLESFSFKITRSGSTEMDTSATMPTTQRVWLDGTEQSYSAYSTTQVPDTFTSIREYCSRAGTNYLAEVDTTFYNDHVRNIYQSTRTGTAGTGQVVVSIPARKYVSIDYVAADGTTTAVWNGTTAVTGGSPLAAKYIHMKWPGWNSGLLIIPTGGQAAAGAKTSMLTYTPSATPRQLDQDRSLLLYLADSASSMGDVSITFDVWLTDGTDVGALATYNASLGVVSGGIGALGSLGKLSGFGQLGKINSLR